MRESTQPRRGRRDGEGEIAATPPPVAAAPVG